MVNAFVYGIIGFFSGLHSACWGLYKDSLYEKATTLKFTRSIFLSVVIGVLLFFLFPILGIENVNLGILFAVCVLIERFTTEIYKGFFRKESLRKYKIPSYFHLGRHIIRNLAFKDFVGVLLFVFLFTLFIILNKFTALLSSFGNHILISMAIGLSMGILEAFGGAEKDAPFEGVEPLKIFRSPIVHMLWGLIFSFFTINYALILFASGGAGRMTIEFYKTFIIKKTPGKFKATHPTHEEWIKKRKKFIFPYVFTWIIFFLLLINFQFISNNIFIILLGLVAGTHAACYGAYKDSPYESFMFLRFLREISFAFLASLFLILSNLASGENYFVLFIVILAISRLLTEFYKLFIRVEDQSDYLIPTQFHFFKKVIHNRALRLLVGLLCVLILIGILAIGNSLINLTDLIYTGAIIGFLTGLATAIGGGYKDGLFEGFEKIKFFRSPVIGAVGGLLISLFTNNILFILLGAIGFERMFVELYKGFLKKGYAPGKFKSKKANYEEWLSKRKIFLYFYILTWIVIIISLLI